MARSKVQCSHDCYELNVLFIADTGEAAEATDAEKTTQIFDAMDADKSGKLDKSEQRVLADKMVRCLLLSPSPANPSIVMQGSLGDMNSDRMQMLLSAMDEDGDGSIDAREFTSGFQGKLSEL